MSRTVRIVDRATDASALTLCSYCGWRVPRTYASADHVHPRSRGGSNTSKNLVAACKACNVEKANHPAGAFLRWLQTSNGRVWVRRRQMPIGSIDTDGVPLLEGMRQAKAPPRDLPRFRKIGVVR